MITRNLTQPLTSAIARAITSPGAGGAFDPATVFSGADAGVVFDYSDAARLATAADGTGAITTAGLIAYGSDAGPLAKHSTQSDADRRPRWLGIPRTLGTEAATNGRFSSDTVWTKGTGWTIASNKASKSAGTASLLSESAALTAGQAYMVFYTVERTAGSVTLQFTGGSTVSGTARSAAGSYSEVVVAATGNNTLAFSADAEFAGAVRSVSCKPVSLFTNMGARFDASNDVLDTAAVDMSSSDKMTMIFSATAEWTVAGLIIAELGNSFGGTVGSCAIRYQRYPDVYLRGNADLVNAALSNTTDSTKDNTGTGVLLTVELDLAQATTGTEINMRMSGVARTDSPAGTQAGGGNFANAVIHIGAAAVGVPWLGLIHRAFIINRALTSNERASVEAWAGQGMATIGVVGDSTVADMVPNVSAVSGMIGGAIAPNGSDISASGHRIVDQKNAWNAKTIYSDLQAVFVQVGLNDIKARIGGNSATSAGVIADLQDLVATIRAAIPAACKIYISGLIPCKAWLNTATNPGAAYAGWQAVNEAIAGNGATPITGVDARITSHVAALNDGSDNLAAIYDYNDDGVHESAEARFIIAQAWRTQLEADGLV